MKINCFIIIILFFLSEMLGQEISMKSISFSYGQTYNVKLDRTYSRLSKNGFNHFFNTEYKVLNRSKSINIQSNFMIGTLKTKGNNINLIDNYAGNLRLKYLKKIGKINVENLSIYVGGNINFSGDVWFPHNSKLRYAWDIYLGIGLAISICHKINSKLFFQYDLDIFLLGVLWRSHNNGQQLITEKIQLEKGLFASVFEIPRFSYIVNTLYVNNSFKLLYIVSNKVDIYYKFTLLYEYIKQPLVKKGYEFSNSIGVTYKF